MLKLRELSSAPTLLHPGMCAADNQTFFYSRRSTFLHQSKTSQLCSRKNVWSRKVPSLPEMPWIGNVSSKFENQINKAITSCFYAVKHRVAYSTRAMLPSAKKDSVPTTQKKNCVVYEFSCRPEARYVGRTTQRLVDRIKQHVPTSIRKKSNTVREQPPRLCKNNSSKINCESAIGQHLLTNPKHIQTIIFGSLGKADRPFI